MNSEIEKAYKYCESVTKNHAKTFYFAAKFLPRLKRKPIYAVYALCRHIDDAVDQAEIASEAEAIKVVENWRVKLDDVYKGETQIQNSNKEEQNLVLLAWTDLLKTYKIQQNLPLELMRGVLKDTHIKRYETFDELYVYCWRVASTVGLMSSEIFGYEKPETLDYAEALGIAMQLTNILRDIKEDAAMNRIYLPQEDLRRFNVTERQIFAGEIDSNFIALIKFQIARARDFYEKSYKGIALLDREARFTVLLALRIYSRILTEIERQNFDVFQRRAHTTLRQKVFSIPKIWLEARNF
jgi:phytoene synthase